MNRSIARFLPAIAIGIAALATFSAPAVANNCDGCRARVPQEPQYSSSGNPLCETDLRVQILKDDGFCDRVLPTMDCIPEPCTYDVKVEYHSLCYVFAGVLIDGQYLPNGWHPPASDWQTAMDFQNVALDCGVASVITVGLYDQAGAITLAEFVLQCLECVYVP